MLTALVSLSLLAVLAACDGEADPRIAEIEALTGDATAGANVFSANCASCHGADGTGGSGPDLTAHSDHSREEIIALVFGGEGLMPAFKDTLENQEIADVVEHVMTAFGHGGE